MLYIAYGSNLNREQMVRRCPGATLVGPAELKGYDLLFRGRRNAAVATVEPLEGGAVPVLLWDIRERDHMALDRFEGWPHVYGKALEIVEFEGKPVPALTYVKTGMLEFGSPSREYLNTIRHGYEAAGFDVEYLYAAVDRSEEQALERDREWELEEMEQLQLDFDNMRLW